MGQTAGTTIIQLSFCFEFFCVYPLVNLLDQTMILFSIFFFEEPHMFPTMIAPFPNLPIVHTSSNSPSLPTFGFLNILWGFSWFLVDVGGVILLWAGPLHCGQGHSGLSSKGSWASQETSQLAGLTHALCFSPCLKCLLSRTLPQQWAVSYKQIHFLLHKLVLVSVLSQQKKQSRTHKK